jgi:hypothetical protein
LTLAEFHALAAVMKTGCGAVVENTVLSNVEAATALAPTAVALAISLPPEVEPTLMPPVTA